MYFEMYFIFSILGSLSSDKRELLNGEVFDGFISDLEN
jgi:hypothetical protein